MISTSKRSSRRDHSDPKPENETAGNLSLSLGCGPLDGSGRRPNATEGAQRRADYPSLARGGGRQEGGRHLPGVWRLAAGVLRLAPTLCRFGCERVAGVATASGGEPEAED